MLGKNSLLKSWLCQFLTSLLLIAGMTVSAAPPAWWSQADANGHAVIDPATVETNPKGPANIGQAKFMARRALEVLEAIDSSLAADIRQKLTVPQPKPSNPSETYPAILNFDVPADPKPAEWSDLQHAPLLIGQLKAIAAPFYEELHLVAPTWLDNESPDPAQQGQLQLNGTKDPADSTNFYPWSSNPNDDQNQAIATIGQLKAVFALRFETLPPEFVDEDLDGMEDSWELANGLDPTNYADAYEDSDSDGIENHHEYLLGFDPQSSSTDGLPDFDRDRDSDGMPDRWEVLWGNWTWDEIQQRYIYVRILNWDVSDAAVDYDQDGLSNFQEYQGGTNPGNNDSDDDGLPNYWEILNGLDPNSSSGSEGANGDPDLDGILNLDEYLLGSDPSVPRIMGFKEVRNANGTVTFTWTSHATSGNFFRIEERNPDGTWKILYQTTYGSEKLPYIPGITSYSMTLNPTTDYAQ